MADKLFGLEYGDPEIKVRDINTFESLTKVALKELSKKQEDYIAEQLMALGWTPPEDSRWAESQKPTWTAMAVVDEVRAFRVVDEGSGLLNCSMTDEYGVETSITLTKEQGYTLRQFMNDTFLRSAEV